MRTMLQCEELNFRPTDLPTEGVSEGYGDAPHLNIIKYQIQAKGTSCWLPERRYFDIFNILVGTLY